MSKMTLEDVRTLIKTAFRDSQIGMPVSLTHSEADSILRAIDAHLATPAQTVDVDRKEAAIELAIKYGGIDGAHHKDWVIDQMVRVLAGDDYVVIVAKAKAGEDGPDTYDWNEGIAP